jgi:hypothetical protein
VRRIAARATLPLEGLVEGAFRGAIASIALALATSAGCREAPPDGPSTESVGVTTSTGVKGPLGTSTALGGAVARVGAHVLDPVLVAKVAQAQQLPPEAAARVLIDEALIAEAAIRAGALRDPSVVRLLDASAARAMIARDHGAALAKGAITDEELSAAMGEEWVDLDRPESRTVVHALVPKDAKDGAALAASLRARLLEAKDQKGFLDAAKAFGVERQVPIVAESLDAPFAIDGRIVLRDASGTTLDTTFTKAAFALGQVGDRSAVVETPFGWHVIELVEIRPEKHAPRATKIEALEPVIVKNRIYAEYEARRARLRAEARESISGSSSDLTLPKFAAPELPR